MNSMFRLIPRGIASPTGTYVARVTAGILLCLGLIVATSIPSSASTSFSVSFRGTVLDISVEGVGTDIVAGGTYSDGPREMDFSFTADGVGMKNPDMMMVSITVAQTDGQIRFQEDGCVDDNNDPIECPYYPGIADITVCGNVGDQCLTNRYHSGKVLLGGTATMAIPYALPSGDTFLSYIQTLVDRVSVDESGNIDFYYLFTSVFVDSSALEGAEFTKDKQGGPEENEETDYEGGDGPAQCSPDQGLPNYWVNTATLNLAVVDTDFSSKGLGPPVAVKRTWNAYPSRKGMFGAGWSFAYESRLKQHGAMTGGVAAVTRGSGKAVSYAYASHSVDGNGVVTAAFKGPQGVLDSLTGVSDPINGVSFWKLREKKTRLVWRYDPDPLAAPGSGEYRLTSITDRNGNALTVGYNTDGTISGITDAAGRQTQFGYNADKRCTSMTTPGNRSATYSYDASGNMTGNVDLLGTAITYTYNASGYMTSLTVGARTTSFTWATEGAWTHIATVTDANNRTKTYAKGIFDTTATDALGHVTTYTSVNGQTIQRKNPLNKSWYTSYGSNGLPVSTTDANGGVTGFEYDTGGNLTKVTDPAGKITTSTYDADGNLTGATDPLGAAWAYTYDSKGNRLTATSPAGKTATNTYDSFGRLTRITDPNGSTTTFTYDLFGNVLTVTDHLNNVAIFSYDGNRLNRTSATDPRGNSTFYQYDDNRRLTRITHQDGTYRSFAYDACAMTSFTDEEGNTTQLGRDGMLNITSVTDSVGAVTATTYNANSLPLTITDPRAAATSYAYDAAGRRTTVTLPLASTIMYGYDDNGNLTAVTDERSKQIAFTYDGNNLLASVKDPLNNTVSYGTNDRGQVTSITSPRGAVGLTYNSDGWLAGKTLAGVTAATFSYDNIGNLTSMTDASGTTTYGYDGANRLTSITWPDTTSVSFTYDAAGNVATIGYPGGTIASYTYDTRNRVSNLTWGGDSIQFAYTAAGAVLTETRSNGTGSAYGYDAARRVTSIRHAKGQTPFFEVAYTRDAAGNITGETGAFPLEPQLFASSLTAAYNDANQLVSRGSSAYAYDSDGNLTGVVGSSAFSATYDLQNRPTRIVSGGITADHAYDGLGARSRSVRGAQTRNFHYDPQGRLLFETDGTSAVTALYLYNGPFLAAMKRGTASWFYHFDRSGNTAAITDAVGDVVQAYAFDPYGRLVNSSGSLVNPFTWVGALGVMDEGNDLYFMKNRYYDAGTGRFIQKDPLGIAGGQTNLYGYVGENPVNRVDPEGTDWRDWAVGIGTAGAYTGGAILMGTPVGWGLAAGAFFVGTTAVTVKKSMDLATRGVPETAAALNRANRSVGGMHDSGTALHNTNSCTMSNTKFENLADAWFDKKQQTTEFYNRSVQAKDDTIDAGGKTAKTMYDAASAGKSWWQFWK